MNLTEIANKWGTDRGTVSNTSHNYTEIYDNLFKNKKNDITSVFEIGVHQGAGLKMWQDYFQNADIYGIEIREPDKLWRGKKPIYDDSDERINVFIGDSSKRDDLTSFLEQTGGRFDIIIDDGEHDSKSQQISFGFLFNHLNSGGYYIIEDLHPPCGSDTVRMINHFDKTSKIESIFMLDSEIEYLNENIDSCERYNGLYKGTSGKECLKLWIVRKK